MKSIQSEGGPLIVLDRALAPKWCGGAEKKFMDGSKNDDNDYDALCAILDQPHHAKKDIVVVRSRYGHALVISMPLVTMILSNELSRTFVIQVHYAPLDWSVNDISMPYLERICQCAQETVGIEFTGEDLILFDSAYAFHEIKDNYLKLKMRIGKIKVDHFLIKPDDNTRIGVISFSVNP